MYIVENGTVEIYTYFEGSEFVIERLGRGAVINHRMQFTDDYMLFNVRCCSLTHLLELESSVFQDIQKSDAKLDKQLMVYQNNLLKQGKAYPLDIIRPVVSDRLE